MRIDPSFGGAKGTGQFRINCSLGGAEVDGRFRIDCSLGGGKGSSRFGALDAMRAKLARVDRRLRGAAEMSRFKFLFEIK